MANPSLDTLKKDVFNYARNRLGEGIVDIELDPAHYETAYERALGIYRQRSNAATEASYAWLELQEDKNEYILPREVQFVRQVFRRTMTTANGPSSTAFDPFSSATLNVYLLNFNYSGGLATYELYSQYQELAARMFGGYMNFTFNPATKKLTLVRNPKGAGEVVLLWTNNLKPEVQLLTDWSTQQWMKDCTYSAAKQIIGEAREKFGSIAGPNGGTTLNGAALKAEAQSEIEALIEDLKNYVDGSDPLSFVIG
jgi:uncharacterized protein YjbJ (UPF0337 family)